MSAELKIEDLVVGDGKAAVRGALITTHYRGFLADGTEFDSSHSRNQPFQCVLSNNRVIQGWIDAGQMAPVNPRHLLYMLWAMTQHYADFGHQIETLNGGAPLSDRQWQEATETVKTIILRGVGLG